MVILPQGIDNKFITLQFQYREDGGQVRGNWRNINQFMPGTAGRYIDFPYSFFKSTGKGDYREYVA